MNFIVILLLLFPFAGITQISGCFSYSDHVYEEFNFNDSTFTYSHSVGLAHAFVNGNYSIQNDTLILNSEFQPDDYELNCFQDSSVLENFISVQIKEIKSANVLDICTQMKRDEYRYFDGKIIYHSNTDVLSDERDTIITEYLIPRDSIDGNLEVIIWRKRQTINLPLNVNRCYLDLTNYPEWLDYVFFKNQKALMVHRSIILLDERNKPIKTKYTVKKRKATTVSKIMKVKEYSKCK